MSRVQVSSVAHFSSHITHHLSTESSLNLLQALILGIVQGITEFFPISSSAHLRLTRSLLSIPETPGSTYFDLTCHSGTLLALIFFLRKEILSTLYNWEAIKCFSLALFPLLPAYFLLKPLRLAASDPMYLGYCLIGTSFLLFLAVRARASQIFYPEQEAVFLNTVRSEDGKSEGEPTRPKTNFSITSGIKYKDVLCIGIMQTIALIPGISRSGATIAAARFLGWDFVSAARFSFLLAIPAILGGQALETFRLFSKEGAALELLPVSHYAVGFLTSFFFGSIGVRAVFYIYEKNIIRPFAWYCLAIGLITAWAFHG